MIKIMFKKCSKSPLFEPLLQQGYKTCDLCISYQHNFNIENIKISGKFN